MKVTRRHLFKRLSFSFIILTIICAIVKYGFYLKEIKFLSMAENYLSDSVPGSLPYAIKLHYKQVSWGEAGSMKFIILAMTDRSFTDMALNLYLSSFKRFEIRNFLFVGAGMNACEKLNSLQIQCFDFWEDPESNISHKYNSKEFIRKMNIRTEMILIALRAGYSVLHTDLDVVFLKNPMLEIEELLKKNDMAILWDHAVHNAGFLAIKATQFSIDVYTTVQALTNSSETLDDQVALNRALHEVKAKYDKSNASGTIISLDKNKYLCGKDYFERNRNFPAADFKDNCPGCMVVHNNWIYGKEAKIYRFKETAMWFLDDGAYYSDEKRKYLAVYNPTLHKLPFDYDVMKEETMALRTGFEIAAILNRTLILPRFHCAEKEECPLISWFKVRDFDRKFSPNYRESSFLLNDLVPQSISMKPRKGCSPDGNNTTSTPRVTSPTSCNKQVTGSNRSNCIPFNPIPILILTKRNANESFYSFSAAMATHPKPEIWNLSDHDYLDQNTIEDKLGKCSDQVLVLASLLDVEVKFSDPKVKAFYKEMLDKGLVGGSYMQI